MARHFIWGFYAGISTRFLGYDLDYLHLPKRFPLGKDQVTNDQRLASLEHDVNVSVIFSTVPIFVYLLAIIFLKRKWRYLVTGVLIISIWGVGVLSSGQLIPTLSSFGIGDFWVLLAAFFEAIWYLGIKLMENKLNSREITVIAQGIACITIFMLALRIGESLPQFSDFQSWQVIAGLLIGVLMNIIAPLLTIFAFKHLDEVFASQLFLSENIFALFVGYFFYGEMIGLISLLGAGIVVASVYKMNKLQTN